MMDKYYQVVCHGEKKSFIEGTTYNEIAEYFKRYYNHDILAIKVNDDFDDLSNTIKKDCVVEFFTIADEYGNKVYSRSARFILILAVKNIFKNKARLVIQHSQNNGIYFKIEGIKDKDKLDEILTNEFQNIVDNNFLFTHLTISRLEAINYFEKKRMRDKAAILKYISNTYINLYRIDDIYDYFYGRMAYSTNQIKLFKIYSLDDGFVLSTPSIFNPNEIPKKINNSLINEKFDESIAFGKSINLTNVSDLNKQISLGKIKDIILMSEAYYDNQLLKLSDDIASKKSKLVLLAGPSSSGKTTTAKKLCIYLKSKGYNTITISLDDYFTNLKDRPKDEDGNYDFESIKAIDVKLFNEQMNALLNNQEVRLPKFDFVKGKRYFEKEYVRLNKNDVIVVEGLHALNEVLSSSIEKKYKYKIYIRPLASLNLDIHNHIHTSDIRKLRRIIRDSKTRGMSASDTLNMWSSIQKGEMNYIYPYQNNVNSVIDSSLMYEIGVLKTYVEPLLYSVMDSDAEYPEAIRLINFLRNFLPIPSDDIPNDSGLREFIGGSCFK